MVRLVNRRIQSTADNGQDKRMLQFKEYAIAVTTLLTSLIFSDTPGDPEGYVRDATNIKTSYDFIIIGAGSAGAVIANRLSEVADWNILLLEAGGDESMAGQIPLFAAGLQLTNKDWQYKTTPQKNACLKNLNQQCNWPRGKMLGGSSSINYMLYVRGNKKDYDNWRDVYGCDGWGYDDVLPYFIKSEDNQNPFLAGTKYHGKGGYLSVGEPAFRSPLGAAFIEGGVEMGYQNRDYNGEFQTGFMFSQGTIRRGSRCSTSKAFLRPVRNRPNLHISMNSQVIKIMIDPDTKTATGVQFEKNGRMYFVEATKEVVLSAGAVASPQILMLSGVGPADHLAEKGIPLIFDQPKVGENLHDHVGLIGMVFLIDKPYSQISASRIMKLPVLLNYTLFGGSAMSTLGGVEGVAFVKSKLETDTGDYPDIQMHFGSGSDISDDGVDIRYAHGTTDEVWNKYYQPIVNRDSWTIFPYFLRPKSRGNILLASNDPYDKPLINPNYFSDPDDYDIRVTVESVKFSIALSKTEAFQKMGSRLYDMPYPGCEDKKLWTDEYWACWIKSSSFTLAHTAGTCRMGAATDKEAVVDPELKFIGIKNLRVADTSIMPQVPSGNSNAATIMVGEKASDLIKKTWL
ncbi:glucose dehydrogenase [FAD, quinone]-like [Daphnia pulex]|uniref:glucose dehydrogenase [FAD, quinone]-like n=1 Tax=Daphnia pulex TaxID=6669 RepID=UPI001EDEB9B0|nr:glucose dehydrogenase [FAD, quinone]-like [Daphnia pulex]